MDLRLIDIFLSVDRHGSFAEAARKLDQDPSVISRAVKQLEHELGVRLFHRTTRRLTLTKAGETFRSRAEPLMMEIAALREDMTRETQTPSGSLRISASVAYGSLCVLPHMKDFRALYPDITVSLQFTDRRLDMIDDRIDLAFRHGHSVQENVIQSRLHDTKYRLCAAPAYVKQYGTPIQPHDITSHRVVCYDLPEFKNMWMFRTAGCDPVPVAIQPGLTISSPSAVLTACLMGHGLALLADWLIGSHLKNESLIDLYPEYEVTAGSFERAVWMLYVNRSFLPQRTRVAIDFFKQKLG